MHPTDKAARIAGAIYAAMILTAPFSLIYVPGKLIVRGNAAGTAENILGHEVLFRLSVFGELVGTVMFIGLGLALYHLLRDVKRIWARLMVAFVLVSAAVGFLNSLNNLAALILVRGGEFLAVIEKPQRDAFATLFLRLHNHGQFINEIFWGLWLLPFGLLVFRSGFLPKFIGGWLILGCFGWIFLSATALLFPSYYEIAFRFAQPVLFGELAIMLWLLLKGAKARPPATRAALPVFL